MDTGEWTPPEAQAVAQPPPQQPQTDVIPGQPLPQDDTHGIIMRPGQGLGPKDYAGNPTITQAPDWSPPEAKPKQDPLMAQMANYSYDKDPLRHIVSEDTARALAQAALKAQGVKASLNDNITDGVLFFLSDNIRNHMSTAIKSVGSDQSWDQLADKYGKLRQTQDDANPTAAKYGRSIGKAADVAVLPPGIVPVAAQAAKSAAQVIAPIAMKAGKWVLYGAGLGLGHKALDAIIKMGG